MKMSPFVLTLGILLGGLTAGHATNIGFGNLGGNNTPIPADLGSYATADGTGYVVSNGTTPNIGLSWDAAWDIHTSNFFQPLEDQFIGGESWDNEGNIPRIGQLDISNHTITFIADVGFALVLNSFDFGQTAETLGTTQWDLSLTDTFAAVVWSQSVTFIDGQVFTISPNFTGDSGEIYTLTFTRTTTGYPDGRVGIDNLSFNQVAIPEPGTIALLGAAGFGLIFLSRRRK